MHGKLTPNLIALIVSGMLLFGRAGGAVANDMMPFPGGGLEPGNPPAYCPQPGTSNPKATWLSPAPGDFVEQGQIFVIAFKVSDCLPVFDTAVRLELYAAPTQRHIGTFDVGSGLYRQGDVYRFDFDTTAWLNRDETQVRLTIYYGLDAISNTQLPIHPPASGESPETPVEPPSDTDDEPGHPDPADGEEEQVEPVDPSTPPAEEPDDEGRQGEEDTEDPAAPGPTPDPGSPPSPAPGSPSTPPRPPLKYLPIVSHDPQPRPHTPTDPIPAPRPIVLTPPPVELAGPQVPITDSFVAYAPLYSPVPEVTLEWEPLAGAVRYEVYRIGSNGREHAGEVEAFLFVDRAPQGYLYQYEVVAKADDAVLATARTAPFTLVADDTAKKEPVGGVPIRVAVAGRLLGGDVRPFVNARHVMIPLRPFFEALGGNVRWEDGRIRVTLPDGKQVFFAVGTRQMIVRSVEDTHIYALPFPLYLEHDRAYLPLESLQALLHLQDTWFRDIQLLLLVPPS